MVYAFVIYCLALNPTMCREFAYGAADHRMTTIMDCAMGGMGQSSAAFSYEGAQWVVKGIRCEQGAIMDSAAIAMWVAEQKAAAARLAPQIK